MGQIFVKAHRRGKSLIGAYIRAGLQKNAYLKAHNKTGSPGFAKSLHKVEKRMESLHRQIMAKQIKGSVMLRKSSFTVGTGRLHRKFGF